MARNPKQDENLKKGKATRFRAGEEQVEIARKGGKASGKARSFKSIARELMDDDAIRKMIEAQMKKAMRGDTTAFKTCMDIGDTADDNSMAEDALSKALEELAKEMTGDDQ